MSNATVSTQLSTARTPFHVLVFAMESNRFALPLTSIEKVLPAVEITLWPHLPSFVAGVIDIRGQVLPVVRAAELLRQDKERASNTSRRFQPGINDHFILLHSQGLRVALWVERALEVVQVGDQETLPTPTSPDERWSPLRIHNELTLLWNDTSLFDVQQTHLLASLCATLATKTTKGVTSTL